MSTCYDLPVKKAMVTLPLKMKGSLKHTSSISSLCLLESRTRISALLGRHYLTKVKLHLQCRLSSNYFGTFSGH